jgi:hypothetical protein
MRHDSRCRQWRQHSERSVPSAVQTVIIIIIESSPILPLFQGGQCPGAAVWWLACGDGRLRFEVGFWLARNLFTIETAVWFHM